MWSILAIAKMYCQVRCPDHDMVMCALCVCVCVYVQEEVMVLERILLQTIKFDLQVDHPYQFLLRYAKQLKGKSTHSTHTHTHTVRTLTHARIECGHSRTRHLCVYCM